MNHSNKFELPHKLLYFCTDKNFDTMEYIIKYFSENHAPPLDPNWRNIIKNNKIMETPTKLKALYEKRAEINQQIVDINKEIEDAILQENISLNEGKTFKVIFSVFFGGSSIIGENLTYEQALKLYNNTATDVYESVSVEEEK